MHYEGIVYRPPSEANSLIIQATYGCPHNRCAFCNMYRGRRFKIRKVEEIMADMDEVAERYPLRAIRSLFLADGNTILMKTDQLVRVLEHARKRFPWLERITSYGASQYLVLKTPEEMRRLAEAGLNRIHCGMESGHDPLLERIHKGGTMDTHIRGGRLVKDAGMELSMYYMPGLGGYEMSKAHALDSAKVLNAVNPDFIRLRTFVPVEGSPLCEDIRAGRFSLMEPHDVLREIRTLVEHLETTGLFYSDHWNNFADISGTLPEDKKRMLTDIDEALTWPRSSFRPLGEVYDTM